MTNIPDNESLSSFLDREVAITNSQKATGGSINDCHVLTLSDGEKVFIKQHRGSTVFGMYTAEARALELLAAPGVIDIPRPLYADDDLLILEAFTEGAPAPDWQVCMGRQLAQLHRATTTERFGFECNNFLGTTEQINDWQDEWITFWREQRLGYQLGLFAGQGHDRDTLVVKGRQLLNRLDEILACDTEPAVLLHGDLWSGNAAANADGTPVIYDPASYYGHREAEFGMMRLFGGFGPACEAAYQEIWPFQPSYDRRIEVYRLYHQLNHLNLFGGSYYAGCLETVRNLI